MTINAIVSNQALNIHMVLVLKKQKTETEVYTVMMQRLWSPGETPELPSTTQRFPITV